MSQIATGVFKQLIAKKQSGLGVKATAAGAQMFRRVKSTIDLSKAAYKSNEIRPTMQRNDYRHGVRDVSGTISGELSVGTYQDFMGSVLRAAWGATVTSGALITVTSAVVSGAIGTFTRSAGSWLTDGFKIGMVVRFTGWATPATANNAHNFTITALTGSVMTVVAIDGVAIVAKAAGDSVTATSAGKSLSIPQSGHTRDYWTIEHNFSDIVQSEQFKDCVFASMDLKLPATGMGTVDFPVLGLDMDTSTSAYFTTPNAVSSGNPVAAVNGDVYVNGTAVALITSFDLKVNGNAASVGGVVGQNVAPDITPGPIDVTGNMTVLFSDNVMRDYFVSESEVSVIVALTTDNTAAANFFAIALPRVKLGGATKDDGEKGLIMTMPFVALENTAGGTGIATNATTITIYDSAAI